MAKQGYYAYDPDNYHGPLHFYVLRCSCLAFGRNLWALRLPTVLVGTLTVGFLFSFTRFFGYRVMALAALAYGYLARVRLLRTLRESNEHWLVFLSNSDFLGFLGWHYRVTPASVWATVLGITGMILTKETYAIHLVAFAAASFLAWIMSKIVRGAQPEAPHSDQGPLANLYHRDFGILAHLRNRIWVDLVPYFPCQCKRRHGRA